MKSTLVGDFILQIPEIKTGIRHPRTPDGTNSAFQVPRSNCVISPMNRGHVCSAFAPKYPFCEVLGAPTLRRMRCSACALPKTKTRRLARRYTCMIFIIEHMTKNSVVIDYENSIVSI